MRSIFQCAFIRFFSVSQKDSSIKLMAEKPHGIYETLYSYLYKKFPRIKSVTQAEVLVNKREL